MNKKLVKRYKLTHKLAIMLAAVPLFQFSQCQTFNNRIAANLTNSLPSVVFQVLFNFALLPIQYILGGGQTTGTGNDNTGGGI